MKAVHYASYLTSLLRHRNPENGQLIYLATRVAIHYVINEIYKNRSELNACSAKVGLK